jgi:TRAP-type mannitol/chloroaromatic compound transport system permease small subunit
MPYAQSSWQFAESSREPGGLPALYLLKSAIPAMAALLVLQGIAMALRCIVTLTEDRQA